MICLRAIKHWFVVALISMSTLVFGAEQELLKTQDITKIMQQIFDEHVNKKEITSSIIQTALKVYIDQFDPERIYLLESDVHPYLHLSQSDLDKMVQRYKNHDFSEFSELNQVIQKSIERARQLRASVEATNAQLFQVDYQPKQEWQDKDHKSFFAKNMEELTAKNRDYLLQFIHIEKKRYGEAYVVRNGKQVFVIYEKYLRNNEDQYLYTHDNNEPLNAAEKDNLFAMHVLKALASSLDSHTSFFNPQEAYDMRLRLEKGFQGIGISLQETPEGILVSSLIAGGPAAKSGLIKVQDKVLEIDGVPVKGISLEKVMQMMRGKDKSSNVTLVLQRKVSEGSGKIDKTFHVQLKKEAIVMDEDRVEWSYETVANGIIGKITLHSFYQNDNGVTSENDVRDAIRKLEKQGNLRGLILDLRENSGGFLSQAVKVAGLFITNGVIVVSKYSNGEKKFYRDMDGKMAYNGPLIVLTSRLTASAAEIVAQALQDYGVAIIVGDEQTYGKGTIQSQTVTENKGTSYFKVTVGEYYTVSGKTPQIQGVKADVLVPGRLNNEPIGEGYLEDTLPPDQISAVYSDPLQDIDPSLKSWYLRYYVPTIQHQQNRWKHMIPTLKGNSEYRISKNKNYQMFLKGELPNESEVEDEYALFGQKKKNFGAEDLQMSEAVNVLKDMIYLRSHEQSVVHNAEISSQKTK